MARKNKRKQPAEGPVSIQFLSGEYGALAREAERAAEVDADRLAEISEQMRRIRSINRFVGAKSLVELRMRGGPISTLIVNHQIGGEEMMAIMDIELARTAISGGLAFKPINYEPRVSASAKGEWSGKVSQAVERYRRWADFWNARTVHGDRTFRIVEAAIIEGRAFRAIEGDLRIRNGRAVRVCIAGLRDYAARSGEVVSRTAQQWMDDALRSFPIRGALQSAIDKHQMLRMQASQANPNYLGRAGADF